MPLVQKDKKDAYWEQRNETSNRDKKKAQFYNPFSFANQPWIWAFNSKKRQKSRQISHLAIGINVTKVTKKNKDNAKDLSHIEYYTYKQKGHYKNKCLQKPKN